MIRRLSLALVAGLFLRCAHVEPPPGGPVDTVQPYVASVYPAPGAKDVPLDARFSVQFSEWIETGAKRGKALLSPPAAGFRAEVDGDRLRFRSSGLQANTAYRLTVLGSLKDLHGNSMGRAFSLAFTTGGDFDSGAVAGRILASDSRAMIVAALYRLGEGDKPPQDWTQPSFLSPADSIGGFSFDSVSQGSYAMIAFADANGNLLPDPGLEPLGIGPADLKLAPRASLQTLRLASVDTAALRFGVVSSALDSMDGSGLVSGLLRLKFSRPPHPAGASDPARFELKSKEGGKTVEVKSAGRDPATGEWLLETGSLQSGLHYGLKAKAIVDYSGVGFAFDTAGSEFALSGSPDTSRWQMSFLYPLDASGKDTLRTPDDIPTGNEFRLRSNKLVTAARLSALEKRAEIRFDTMPPVTGEWRKLGPLTLSLRVKNASLAPGQGLRVRLKPLAPDTVVTALLAGKAPDSTRMGSFHFRVPEANKGWTLVLRGGWPWRETVLPPSEIGDTARFYTSAGPQRLFAFLDRDQDGIWHPGSLRPYLPQEPMIRLLDSLVVPPGSSVDVTESLAR